MDIFAPGVTETLLKIGAFALTAIGSAFTGFRAAIARHKREVVDQELRASKMQADVMLELKAQLDAMRIAQRESLHDIEVLRDKVNDLYDENLTLRKRVNELEIELVKQIELKQ